MQIIASHSSSISQLRKLIHQIRTANKDRRKFLIIKDVQFKVRDESNRGTERKCNAQLLF